MGRLGLVFPGIGVDWCGAEWLFLERHASVMTPFLEQASAMAGKNLVLSGDLNPVERLSARETELLTHAFNCGVNAVLAEAGLEAVCATGHSLGLYSAVAASGAVGFADSLKLVDRACALVREACPGGRDSFAMGAVVGLAVEDVRQLARPTAAGGLEIAIQNNPYSFVVSGPKEDVERFLAEAGEQGAPKVIRLRVDYPYHNPALMGRVIEPFERFLRTLPWTVAARPVLCPFDQLLWRRTDGLIRCVAQTPASPFNWLKTMGSMMEAGIDTVVECGPGISLTQNARFIAGLPPHVNLKNIRSRLGL